MKPGKKICELLKSIRADIASANEIDYRPTPCNYEGDCSGTCPQCDNEVRWLENQLRVRHSLGKAVTIVGLSLATVPALSSCVGNVERPLAGAEDVDTTEQVLEGDVVAPEPDSTTDSTDMARPVDILLPNNIKAPH